MGKLINLTEKQPVDYAICARCDGSDWKMIRSVGTGKIIGVQCATEGCGVVAYFSDEEVFEFEVSE